MLTCSVELCSSRWKPHLTFSCYLWWKPAMQAGPHLYQQEQQASSCRSRFSASSQAWKHRPVISATWEDGMVKACLDIWQQDPDSKHEVKGGGGAGIQPSDGILVLAAIPSTEKESGKGLTYLNNSTYHVKIKEVPGQHSLAFKVESDWLLRSPLLHRRLYNHQKKEKEKEKPS